MITTIAAKLISKTAKHPSGYIQITVSEEDAAWIQDLTFTLGCHGHPSVVPDAKNGLDQKHSLARLVMRHHGIPVDDDSYICRKDLNPLNLTHENLCVPVAIFQRHLKAAEKRAARTISLKEYLNVFSVKRPAQPDTEPAFVPVIDMDTAKEAYLIADQDDVEWLTGMPVRFNEKGFPMIQRDWDKWTPLMFEQARRGGAQAMNDPVVFHLKSQEPRDVRKHYIAILSKDKLATMA